MSHGVWQIVKALLSFNSAMVILLSLLEIKNHAINKKKSTVRLGGRSSAGWGTGDRGLGLGSWPLFPS